MSTGVREGCGVVTVDNYPHEGSGVLWVGGDYGDEWWILIIPVMDVGGKVMPHRVIVGVILGIKECSVVGLHKLRGGNFLKCRDEHRVVGRPW